MRRRFAPWPSAHFALAFARQNVIYARNVIRHARSMFAVVKKEDDL